MYSGTIFVSIDRQYSSLQVHPEEVPNGTRTAADGCFDAPRKAAKWLQPSGFGTALHSFGIVKLWFFSENTIHA